MKRNKQQKFRMKIIQELHLNKIKQKELDNFIRNKNIVNYEEIYKYRNYPNMLKAYCAFKNANIKMRDISNKFISGSYNPYTRMIKGIYSMYDILNNLKEEVNDI